jgi:hypothetical protein
MAWAEEAGLACVQSRTRLDRLLACPSCDQ